MDRRAEVRRPGELVAGFRPGRFSEGCAEDYRQRPAPAHCADLRAGVRSSEATYFLLSQGFTRVSDIGEGMLGSRAGPGWLDRKLPLD